MAFTLAALGFSLSGCLRGNHPPTHHADGIAKGYTVAFASFAPIDTDVFVARGDGSAARPLLQGDWQDYNASLSSDGSWVTFTSERSGSADLYRVRLDGTHLEPLVTGPSFDDQGVLSPDGGRLAFVSDRGGQADIWVKDLKSGGLTNVTHHPGGDFRPAWSPDGRWLAFSSDRDSPRKKFAFVTLHSTAIYLTRADGSEVRQLTLAGQFAGSPKWSADGKQIVFYECDLENVNSITSPRRLRGTTQIVTIDVATSERRVWTEGKGEKWSPQWLAGQRIAFVSGGPEGGVEFSSGAAGARGQIGSPSWSTDGTRMVFHRDVGSGWPPLQRWPSLNSRFSLVRTGVFPSSTPKGDIVSNDQTAGNLHNNIIRINVGGGAPKLVFHDEQRSALAPAVSPDGTWIAFGLGGFFQAVRGKSSADIALVRSDGSGLQLLTKGDGNYALPAWSPDGGQIVYRAAGGAQDGLYVIDLATRETRHIPGTVSNDNFPSWSPKGDRIAFTSNREGDYDIYTVRPDGTDLRRLTFTAGNDAHNSWSPDGEWIVFTGSSGGFKDEAVLHPYNPQPYGDLYAMRSDGTEVHRLTNNQYEEGTPAWLGPNE